MGGRVEGGANLRAIVAQEVDRLAHLGDGVRQGLARLAHDDAKKDRHASLEEIGGAKQCRGPLDRRCGRPDRRSGDGLAEGSLHVVLGRLHHRAHHVAPIGRVANKPSLPLSYGVADQRRGPVRDAGACEQCC